MNNRCPLTRSEVMLLPEKELLHYSQKFPWKSQWEHIDAFLQMEFRIEHRKVKVIPITIKS